jgi:hypothetical protein
LFSDLIQGVNEWNGVFYSASQFQEEIIQPNIDRQRWALAESIAAQNGQDTNEIYDALDYEGTQGGNSDFLADNDIDMSFLNGQDNYRAGDFPSVHEHTNDGLIHLDTANPDAFPPFGLFVHFFVDVVVENINPSVPLGR